MDKIIIAAAALAAFIAAARYGTACAEKAGRFSLGTGKNDYALEADLSKAAGNLIPRKLDPRWKAQAYALNGFTNGSPNWGTGAFIYHDI